MWPNLILSLLWLTALKFQTKMNKTLPSAALDLSWKEEIQVFANSTNFSSILRQKTHHQNMNQSPPQNRHYNLPRQFPEFPPRILLKIFWMIVFLSHPQTKLQIVFLVKKIAKNAQKRTKKNKL